MTAVNPVETYVDVPLSELLITVMRKRQENLRLVQICCSVVQNQYEVIYSFTNDDTYELTNLRVMVGLNETIPSICDSYPYANYYENEMSELFGLSIELIDGDYHGKFYRIQEEAPLLNKKAKEAKAVEAEEIRKAAEEAAHMPAADEMSDDGGTAAGQNADAAADQKTTAAANPEIKIVKKKGGGE
ncbi:MAG: NADH-quinone oxidoreductase subunit C [Eubacteriales bacterium]|jgi:hypothetical protein